MIKTPITVLQELMIKMQEIPSYECIAQTGPQHLSVFEYRCVAHGVTARGVARSKKEAKQEAARRALSLLAARGVAVPPPYHIPTSVPEPPPAANESALPLPSSSSSHEVNVGGGETGAAGRLDSRSYVTLLKELCEEYRLGAVAYELVGDTGPPHLRRFTIRAVLGSHERVATATTKKAARQMAAEQLYLYLRENLATATKDFVENRREHLLREQYVPDKCHGVEETEKNPRKRKSTDDASEDTNKRYCDDIALNDEGVPKKREDALCRALDKAMMRYAEVREEQPWRPDLGQRIADYHLDGEQQQVAEKVLEEERGDSEALLQETAAALGLTVELSTLPAEGGSISVVTLGQTTPTLTLAGKDPPSAARAALRYLRRALAQRPDSDIAA